MPSQERARTEPDSVTLREIALRLTGLAHASLAGRLRGTELILELRAIATWIEGGTKPATPAKEEVTTQVEAELFQYWQARFNKPRARFTPERRRVLRARLREGYTPEDIRRAIDGCKGSPFHSGDNTDGKEYNDLLLICRNGSKLEGFRELAGKAALRPLAVTQSEETEEQVNKLVRDGADALKKGDVNAYNRTQEEIRRLRGGGRDDRQGAEAARPERAAGAR